MDNNLLFINTKNNCFDRLAYTKSIYQLIFKCQLTSLKRKISRTNWKKHYQKDYCVRSHNLQITEKELGSLIWHRLSNPRVNLTNPKTLFEFINTNKAVYCGRLIWANHDKFEQRKAHLRPELHPTSLHPKLARAMVNISRIKKSQVILDPFMGSGGILIEAGLIGCKIIGNDIDRKMIEKGRTLDEIYDISFQERVNSVRSSFLLFRQHMMRLTEKRGCLLAKQNRKRSYK